jgi:hypothetical protein
MCAGGIIDQVTVPLKLNQMKYLVDGKLPKDISNALIFTSTGLERLKNRIKELQEEKVCGRITTIKPRY